MVFHAGNLVVEIVSDAVILGSCYAPGVGCSSKTFWIFRVFVDLLLVVADIGSSHDSPLII